MRVLVTGGTSLIGREVAYRLRDRGEDVVLFQRGHGPAGFEQRHGDLADAETVTAAVCGVDAVVHLAAKAGISGAWSEYESANVRGTANVLAAAVAERVQRFVHISSPSVAYAGKALAGAGAEPADPARARGHYARSKAQAELLALGASSPTFPVVVLRPHLIWGPEDQQLVARIVARARAQRLAIIGSGAALIDSTYVTNAADAIVAGLDRAPEIQGRAYVVSNGQPRPVAELIERIVRAARLAPPRVRVPYLAARAGGLLAERIWERFDRKGDPPMTGFLAEQLGTAHWFDQRETRAALHWEPAVPLEEGFRRLGEWFAQQ